MMGPFVRQPDRRGRIACLPVEGPEQVLSDNQRLAGEPEAGDLLALRELAVHHEHRSRELAAAVEAVDRGLELADRRGAPRAAEEFRRRRERLLRKLARRV